MKGKDVVAALRKKLRTKTTKETAARVGLTSQGIRNWQNRRNDVKPSDVARLVAKAQEAERARVETTSIRPIVEFHPIDRAKPDVWFDIFDVRDGGKSKHPYREGLRQELEEHRGVYIFYDSRGRALYAGKAARTTLWREMKSAFNRDRGVQMIKRVRHPERRQRYRNSDERARQIRAKQVGLHDLAHYFGAYAVQDGMINELESLLVRGFANDLLNVRMEKFSRHRSARKKARKSRRGRR